MKAIRYLFSSRRIQTPHNEKIKLKFPPKKTTTKATAD
jgi:hypothetical protein